MTDQCYDGLFKLLLIGDSKVGKSSLLSRFTDGVYTAPVATIGVDFKSTTVESRGRCCMLQIWDTSGDDRFRTITSMYFRGAHAVFLVYSITSLESFQALTQYIAQVEQLARANVYMILIGNNSDQEAQRVVSSAMGQQLADHHTMDFFETSPRDDVNVQEAFQHVADDLHSADSGTSRRSKVKLQRHRLNRIRVTWLLCLKCYERGGCSFESQPAVEAVTAANTRPDDVLGAHPEGRGRQLELQNLTDSTVQHLLGLSCHLFEHTIQMLDTSMFPEPTDAEVFTYIGSPHSSTMGGTCGELESTRETPSRFSSCMLM